MLLQLDLPNALHFYDAKTKCVCRCSRSEGNASGLDAWQGLKERAMELCEEGSSMFINVTLLIKMK